MKKMMMTGLFCLSICVPSQVSAQSILERVVTDVILGVYDRPYYDDHRPYYFYNNRYYYGGEWRNGYYYYQGKRLRGGHYYERGYYDHYGKDYKVKPQKPKHPNHKKGYYEHNKHYLGEHQHEHYEKRDRYEDHKSHTKQKSHKKNAKENKHKK